MNEILHRVAEVSPGWLLFSIVWCVMCLSAAVASVATRGRSDV